MLPENSQEYGSLIALLQLSHFWQVSSANTRPKGSCFMSPMLSPLSCIVSNPPAHGSPLATPQESGWQGKGGLPACSSASELAGTAPV